MSLIICNEDCRHKQEGYCALNHISRLTADTAAKCGYYEAINPNAQRQSGGYDTHSYRKTSTDGK